MIKLRYIIFRFFDILLGYNIIGILRERDRILRLSFDEIQEERQRRLTYFIKYVYEHSSYYRERLEKVDLNIFNIEDLKSLPILEKADLNENIHRMVTKSFNKLYKSSSSGSTGKRTDVFWTRREVSIYRAMQLLWWKWAGYEIGEPMIQTGITPKRGFLKSLKDLLLNVKYVQAFSHSKSDSDEVLQWVNSQKSKVFVGGYPSSIYAIVQNWENLNSNIKSIICWGDKLFENYKNFLECRLNTRVFETYGSAEGLMIAANYDQENLLYVMSPFIIIEIVDENGLEVSDGKMGNVLITNLDSFGTPLIRYRIGDLAIKLPRGKYPLDCKLNLEILEKVVGRDTDLIKTRDGKTIVVHSFTGFFEHIDEIQQFRVIQYNLNEINIEYIKTEKENPIDESKIILSLNKLINSDIVINMQEVNSIPNTPSGKPQIIQSFLECKK